MSLSILHHSAIDLVILMTLQIAGMALSTLAFACVLSFRTTKYNAAKIAGFRREIGILFIGLCLPAFCAAEPIVWFEQNLPPSIITEGSSKGQGYGDQIINFVLHNLPQYQVALTEVPHVREEETMKRGGTYCTRDFMESTDRDAFLRFTAPVGYVLPVGLIVRVEDTARYDRYADANHTIRLESLLSSDPGTLGVAALRKYGAATDNVIAQVRAKQARKISIIYEDNGTATLLKMLDAHHIDEMLAYPTEETYLSTQLGMRGHYYFYPIAESPVLVSVRFSCTKQAATDGIFSDLDIQAKSVASQNVFQADYERWLPPYLLSLYRTRLKDDSKIPGL